MNQQRFDWALDFRAPVSLININVFADLSAQVLQTFST